MMREDEQGGQLPRPAVSRGHRIGSHGGGRAG